MILTNEELGLIWLMLPASEADKLILHIRELTIQRDTAHAAAIQAAAIHLKARWPEIEGYSERYQCVQEEIERVSNEILSLTPADAQRCYDLRIAEAIAVEAQWWAPHTSIENMTMLKDRLASTSAEVERLKAPADV